MERTSRQVHSSIRAGVELGLGLGIAFVVGLCVAFALIENHGFAVKREIDLVEVAKITLLALAALFLKRHHERRDRAEAGEREQLLAMIDEATRQANELITTYTAAEVGPRGAVTTASREKIVSLFDALDSSIFLLERLLYECSCTSPEDRFTGASEKFNDAVMVEGLTAFSTGRAKALQTHRELVVELARARLRVVRM